MKSPSENERTAGHNERSPPLIDIMLACSIDESLQSMPWPVAIGIFGCDCE